MNKTTAIISCIVTIVIALVGFSAYDSGTHYMTWLGIPLSQGGFIGLICVFILLDILALRRAFSAEKQLETANWETKARFVEEEPFSGEPCTVYLTRLSSVAGAAVSVRVYLNGAEQEPLKNGRTLILKTLLPHNELKLVYNAGGTVCAQEFEAEPGGSIRAVLRYNSAKLTLTEGAPEASGEPDEKGRYRQLKKGYIVWAAINLPVYFLGLVPLFKTLDAARQPIDDVAEKQLRSAKRWNIALSCVLVGVVATVWRILLSV